MCRYFWQWSDSAVNLHVSKNEFLDRTATSDGEASLKNLVESWFMTVKMNFTSASQRAQCILLLFHVCKIWNWIHARQSREFVDY